MTSVKKGIDGKSNAIGEILTSDLKVNSVVRNRFGIMRQSSATNKLAMMKTSLYSQADSSDTLEVENGNLKVTLENFSTLGNGLKTTTHRLVDAIMLRATELGLKDKTVYLSIEEYMNMCGLKNLREMRKQVNAELRTLENMHITFNKSSNREQSFDDIKICEATDIKNNHIIFTFSDEFYRIMKSMPVMPYPMKLFNINNKKNPNSYYFLKKLAEHKKMNYFKKNSDTISVRTLLECTPELPAYDDVISGDRAVARRIIEPFERDLNELEDVLKWEYCHSNGTPLTDEETENFNYHIFYGLMIKINWIDYPELQKKQRTKKKVSVE
ncbi:MAG: hypothetical protein IJP18_10320 [Oscillospiraceae bacterium]|nr:hypothetical protein [Oscillospiraceae bacterium]MBQ9982942.1 hypothetical protein [Oscillospiraceae bacterium]